MTTVGDYQYPGKINPERAEEIARLLWEEYDGQEPDKDDFAQKLNHKSSNSGAFIRKVADLRRYGILPSTGMAPTNLSERLAYGSEKEKAEARVELLENIELLNKLDEKLNGNKPSGRLAPHIRKICGCDRKTAREHEEEISQLYNRLLDYKERASKSEEVEKPAQETEENQTPEAQTQSELDNDVELLLKDSRGNEIRVRELSDLDLAEVLMDNTRTRLERKQK